MSTLLGPDQRHRGPIRRLDAVVGGPLWWAVHLGGMYWLVPRSCEWGVHWPLHLLTVAMLGLCVRAGLSGVQLLRAGAAAHEQRTARRDVFLGWFGLGLAVFFGAVVAAEWAPSAFVDPCL